MALRGAGAGGEGSGSAVFAISRKSPQFLASFPQLPFARPPRVRVGAPCVPCAEVLLPEASGGLVTAPQFSRNFPAVFSQLDLTLPDHTPPPPAGAQGHAGAARVKTDHAPCTNAGPSPAGGWRSATGGRRLAAGRRPRGRS